jgi:MFS family permease
VSSAFRALRTRNYRLWVSGTLVSNVGTWMQRTAQDWLVLVVLTDHSGLAVGLTTGLQFTPLLLFSVHAGVLADRLPKRQLLYFTQTAMGSSSLFIGILVVIDKVQLWEVFLSALILGLASSVDNPARQAFISEIVPPKDVISAVSLNSASMNLARLVGPGVAGVIIAAYGTGPAFLINAASFGATLISLACMSKSGLRKGKPAPARRGQVREGLRYAYHRPDLMLVLSLAGVVCTFGMNFQMTNAMMATGAFHRGASQYGLLGTMLGVGALSGALIGARRERPRLYLLVGASLAFGAVLTAAALSPSYLLYAILLIFVGLSSMTLLNSCNTAVQLSAPPMMRGRMIALYVAVRQGTAPIGAPFVGWLGGQFGVRWSVLVGGIASLVAGALCLVLVARMPRIRAEFAEAIKHSLPAPAPPPAQLADEEPSVAL